MPRTAIAVQTPKGPFVALPVVANSLDVAFTAADVANKNEAAFGSGRLLVIAKNDDVGAVTITITSSAAPGSLRTGDIGPYTMQAGEIIAYVVERDGFIQAVDGKLYFEASDADVKFAILAI